MWDGGSNPVHFFMEHFTKEHISVEITDVQWRCDYQVVSYVYCLEGTAWQGHAEVTDCSERIHHSSCLVVGLQHYDACVAKFTDAVGKG